MKMRILVTIASYGTANDTYLAQLIREYRSMPYDIDLVVLSNIPKDVALHVELLVGLPNRDPWSLPFAHKQVLADRADTYDLFIYSEDDTLITDQNIKAFLDASAILPEDEIAGFLRLEVGPDGRTHYPDMHGSFHWDPKSLRRRGNHTFACFTCEHSACYILTRRQLKHAIDSGGFLVGPHKGKYDLACSAATDPYTQCGFQKMICISGLHDFFVRHLPNKYVGTTFDLAESDFYRQIEALLEIGNGRRLRSQLLPRETRWSKSYYEPSRPDILEWVPAAAKNVLSIGCGWGVLEGRLADKGIRVVGIPLDSVISACAEARGVETVLGEWRVAREKLEGERFDCLLMSNILHLVEDPLSTLTSFAELLSSDAIAIAVLPNLTRLPVIWGRIWSDKRFEDLGSYERAGVHLTSHRIVREWFKSAGMKIETITDVLSPRFQKASQLTLGLANSLLASEFITVSTKVPSASMDREVDCVLQ